MNINYFSREEFDILYNALTSMQIDVPELFFETCSLPDELLEKIKKVEIRRSFLDDLDFLTLLPNLEELVIDNLDYDRVADFVDYDETGYFNHIYDYSAISKLTNLRKIKICNDTRIKSLDFSNMPHLTDIQLIDNPDLYQIKGFENLHHLNTVVMYGNHITEFENFEAFLHNTLDAKINIIDLSAFFSYVRSLGDAVVLNNIYFRGLANVQFAEKNGQVGHYTLDIPTIVNLYKKFNTLFRKKGLYASNVTDEERIDYIYKYVSRYVDFAQAELAERERLYLGEVRDQYGRIPEFYERHFGSLHSSFYAYHFRRANCEGMVNLMKFMSSMFGIDSEDVHCTDKRSNSSSLNHAVYRTKYNGVYCYYDPAFFSVMGKKGELGDFSKLSFDSVSSYLNLSRYEREKSYGSYRKVIRDLVDKPEEFGTFATWLRNEEFIDKYSDENSDGSKASSPDGNKELLKCQKI